MRKIFSFVFLFGLYSAGYAAGTLEEIPPVKDVQKESPVLISMVGPKMKDDADDSVLIAQQENIESPNAKDREYQLLKSQIRNRRIADDALLKTLYARWLLGIDLDTLHPKGQPTLASLLVQVSCPYDDLYTENNNNSNGRFRELGNMIHQIIDEESLPDNLSFAGSALERRFAETSHFLITGERVETCCNIQ